MARTGGHVQAYDVPHLLPEEGIAGEFESFAAMRLYGNGLTDLVYGGLRQPVLLPSLVDTPVSSGRRLCLQCATQQLGHFLIGN